MSNPKIMLVDEPSQGLSPIFVKTVTDIIKNLCEKHKITILLVEQNYRVAQKLGDRHT